MTFVMNSHVGRFSALAIGAAIGLGLLVAPAQAVLTLAPNDTTNTHSVTSVSDTATGATMATGLGVGGPLVTVTFTNGSTSSDIWATIGGGSANDGNASNTGWSLTKDGDTFDNFSTAWSLVNSSSTLGISRVVINAMVGAVAFDRAFFAPPFDIVGTAGSSLGTDFVVTGGSDVGLTGTATYSEQIALFANAGVAVGDLFGVLTLIIDGGGLPAGSTLTFQADTDLLSEAVPEASQILAFAMVGLVSAGGVYLRKRRAQQAA